MSKPRPEASMKRGSPAKKSGSGKKSRKIKITSHPTGKTAVKKSIVKPKGGKPALRRADDPKSVSKPQKRMSPQKTTGSKNTEVKFMGSKKKSASKERLRLEKELKGQIAKIDDAGLVFLLKQAHVILHNLEVDKINREIDKFESTRKKGKQGKAVKEASRAVAEVKPGADGKSFIIVLNNARKIFNLPEMRKMVAICEYARGESDASARLYSWFSQNRGDVLGDAGIGNPRNPTLALLYRVLKSKYKTKK